MILIAILFFILLIALTVVAVILNLLFWILLVLGWADMSKKNNCLILMGVTAFSVLSFLLLFWSWPAVIGMF